MYIVTFFCHSSWTCYINCCFEIGYVPPFGLVSTKTFNIYYTFLSAQVVDKNEEGALGLVPPKLSYTEFPITSVSFDNFMPPPKKNIHSKQCAHLGV